MFATLVLSVGLTCQLAGFPSVDDRLAATKRVDAVFGAQSEAAKSSDEKILLSRKMLKTAEGERDPATKFVLLAKARDLAIAANDKHVAIDATRAIVSAFEAPESAPEGKWVEKGEEAWDAAHGRTVGRLDAIEWFLRAEPTASGLDKALIEKRLKEFADSLREGEEYLTSLPPQEIITHERPDQILIPVRLENRSYSHSIYITPLSDSGSHVAFRPKEKFKTLSGLVGIADTADAPVVDTAVTFRIVADGRAIWKSKRIQKRSDSQSFSASIRGAKKIELIVECPGSNGHCSAIWVDPILSK